MLIKIPISRSLISLIIFEDTRGSSRFSRSADIILTRLFYTRFSISYLTASNLSMDRAIIITPSPNLLSSIAKALPIPSDPPVIITQ